MELQQQVVNLELSKKMKELGFKQESYFIWYLRNEETKKYILCSRDIFQEGISAYTVAELGEILNLGNLYIEEWRNGNGGKWCIELTDWKGKDKKTYNQEAETEADARAKMLCYLKENNLL
jgi:hypothetical protein